MRHACVLLRFAPHTKKRAFEDGLKRLGFDVDDNSSKPREGDVLVMWNRYFRNEKIAQSFERAGAKVIVAENGWIGKIDGCKPIALSLGHHNGAGEWFIGDEDRWAKCGVELKPWRENGEHILLLPSRGFGEEGVKMPRDWPTGIMGRVAKVTKRKFVVRIHPGTAKPKDPDFSNTWAAITWASGSGIKALAAGIPVFYEMPTWIGRLAATFGLDGIEKPYLGDRLATFHALAHAQWSPIEIETGEPFVRLLEMPT